MAFFVEELGFSVLCQDFGMAIIARDGANAYIVQNQELAVIDLPELGIDKDEINGVLKEMNTRAPSLHSPSKTIAIKPRGERGLSTLDKTTVCVAFRE